MSPGEDYPIFLQVFLTAVESIVGKGDIIVFPSLQTKYYI